MPGSHDARTTAQPVAAAGPRRRRRSAVSGLAATAGATAAYVAPRMAQVAHGQAVGSPPPVAATPTPRPTQTPVATLAAITWRSLAPMNVPRFGLGLAWAANGRLYAAGGSDLASTPQVSAALEEYDPTTNTWAFRAPLLTPRNSLELVAHPNGRVYAIGGRVPGGQGAAVSVVEEYDPATNTWTPKAPMPTPRAGFGAVAAPNGLIYAIGGTLGTGVGTVPVEAYDPATNTWTPRAPMPTPRSNFDAVLGADDRIYAVGGYFCCVPTVPTSSVLGTVEVYDPTTNTWSAAAPMPTPRQLLGVAAVPGGRIYATGGDAIGPVVEVYDPATNGWVAGTPMPGRRSDHGAAASPGGRIYLAGGITTTPPNVPFQIIVLAALLEGVPTVP